MANAFTKEIGSFWDQVLEGWDAANAVSNQVRMYKPEGMTMQRQNDTIYRPMDYQVDTVDGLDISGSSATDLIQRQVSGVLGSPKNVKFTLTAAQLRDPWHMKQAGAASGKRLAAKADSDIATMIALRAANVVTQSGVFDWDLSATAKRILVQKGLPGGSELKQVLNPLDAQKVAKELGSRAFFQGKTEAAFVRNQVPDIAGVGTYEADIMPVVAAKGTVTSITAGAALSHTVTAMTGDVPTDNRQATLTLSGANLANVKNGDCFTVSNSGTVINSVHNITKDNTGEPQTFRVISGGGTSSVVIYPAPVASGPYQNVTAGIASGATLTFINNTAKAASVMWEMDSVEMLVGEYDFPTGMGPSVMKSTTSNGLPLVMSYSFDHMTGVVTGRIHTIYTPLILQPEKCALMLASQS